MKEPPLAFAGRGAAEAGMGVEDRQQGKTDPCCGARRSDPFRHLGDVGVMTAILVVMQVVEFTDAAKTRLQHFHIQLCRHRLHLIRRHR